MSVYSSLVWAVLTAGIAPGPASEPVTHPSQQLDERLDLNTATVAQLAGLPGMGAVYARRIAQWRPYSAKNQLVTRGVLPRETYEQIKDRVVAHRQRTP